MARLNSMEPDHDRRRTPTLVLIAVFKLVKSALLILSGLTALKLAHGGFFESLARFAEQLPFRPGVRILYPALERLLRLSPGKLTALGVGGFGYGVLFLVEGIGLFLVKRWAEYLTVVSTAGFIPLEIVEIVREPTALKWATLVVNVAIVVYLIVRLKVSHVGRLRQLRAA